MQLLLLFTLVLVHLASWGECGQGCRFSLGDNVLNHPLVLQKVGQRYKFVLLNDSPSLFLNNDQQVIVTCQGQSFGFCSDKFGSVQLLCKHNQAFIAFNGKTVEYSSKKYQLGCKAPVIQHFPYPVQGCHNFGVIAAFVNHVRTDNPNNNLVKVVEYCYDLRIKKVLFAHYKVMASNYLDEQFLTNVGSSLSTDISIIKGQVSPVNFYSFGPNFGLLGLPPPHGYGFVVGHRADLELINPAYRTAISQSSLNVYSEWNVLRSRNWLKLADLLRSIAKFNGLNVYSGTTNAHLSDNKETQPVLRESRAPFYVWSLVQVKPFSSENSNVVVVAVNVADLPQSEAENYVFCNDICNTIPWMAQLGSSRTDTNYGFMFCCSIEEAATKIPELPQVFRRRPRTTTTPLTTRRPTPTILVTRPRRTTFAPFPCRQIHQLTVQSPAVPRVKNVDDIVLDSSELEHQNQNHDERNFSLLDQDSRSRHWGQGLENENRSTNWSGRHSVEERHWGHRHNGEEGPSSNNYSGESRNWAHFHSGEPSHWGSSDSHNTGGQLQGSLEKVPSESGVGSQEENNQIWDLFWAGAGSQERDSGNVGQQTITDQQEQTISTVVGDQQNVDNHNQLTVERDNPSQGHRRKILKGHVVGFVNNNASAKTKSLLAWNQNKSHSARHSRELVTSDKVAKEKVQV